MAIIITTASLCGHYNGRSLSDFNPTKVLGQLADKGVCADKQHITLTEGNYVGSHQPNPTDQRVG